MKITITSYLEGIKIDLERGNGTGHYTYTTATTPTLALEGVLDAVKGYLVGNFIQFPPFRSPIEIEKIIWW